jgi:hypothetical protein
MYTLSLALVQKLGPVTIPPRDCHLKGADATLACPANGKGIESSPKRSPRAGTSFDRFYLRGRLRNTTRTHCF